MSKAQYPHTTARLDAVVLAAVWHPGALPIHHPTICICSHCSYCFLLLITSIACMPRLGSQSKSVGWGSKRLDFPHPARRRVYPTAHIAPYYPLSDHLYGCIPCLAPIMHGARLMSLLVVSFVAMPPLNFTQAPARDLARNSPLNCPMIPLTRLLPKRARFRLPTILKTSASSPFVLPLRRRSTYLLSTFMRSCFTTAQPRNAFHNARNKPPPAQAPTDDRISSTNGATNLSARISS